MSKLGRVAMCFVLVAGLAAAGCDSGGGSCTPEVGTTCLQGVTYWVDSCGERGEVADSCVCGCADDGLACRTDCPCLPQCTGKECGPDGCGASCGDCTAPESCDADGQCVACAPDCAGKQCGDDGCGGSCGTCDAGMHCDAQGGCVPDCLADCEGRVCGPDGCGGSCGDCDVGAGEVCVLASGQCQVCAPDCAGRACGPDPTCGASCGTCGANEQCDADGVCQPVCSPDCAGKECGDDGCGGSCGTCTVAGEACEEATGQCEACSPDCAGKECGDDGCDGSCGSCTAPETCQADGTCACVPDCLDRECGDDGCGNSCGACTAPESCNQAGLCECVPDCQGKECGDDGCNGSCGECVAPDICQVDGTCWHEDVPCCGVGQECGLDPCMGTSCGSCTAPESCQPDLTCACLPDCTGRECGDDGCGGSCGTCTGAGEVCEEASGQCQVCVPNCAGRECGPDPTCGSSCGTCAIPGESCDASGQCVAGDPCPNGAVTIAQIQDVDAVGHPAEGAELCVQDVVVTTPVITINGTPVFYVEDAGGGQWSGVYVYASGLTLDPGVVQGASLAMTGTYAEYYGRTELVPTAITVLGAGVVPAPIVVSPDKLMTGSVSAESYEGVLVRVEDVDTLVTPFPGSDGLDHGDFQVAAPADPTSLLVVGWQFQYPFVCPATGPLPQVPCATDQRALGQTFTRITGVMDYSWSEFRLMPREDPDVVLEGGPVDTDGDGLADFEDNCRLAWNPQQEDQDLDGVGDLCDNCVAVENPDQLDSDGDSSGNLCDNCPWVANPGQEDADGDGVGDACEGGARVPHLVITELCVTPSTGEFIEIHNPTANAVDLGQYYLWDATYTDAVTPANSRYYWQIASLVALGVDNDFVARFPDGSTLAAGATATIAVNTAAAFQTAYGEEPTFALRGDGLGLTLDMVPAFAGAVGANAGLSNAQEVVVLFRWDGAADLVQDVDYVLWGGTNFASDKTGVSVGSSAYLPDTPIAEQVFPPTHTGGQSLYRADLLEGAELQSGGNGLGGHDETSENLDTTFAIGAPSPGTP